MDTRINTRLHDLHYFDEDYKAVKEFVPVFNHPFLTFQKISPIIDGVLTYRQINFWEEEGLISGTRKDNEKTWRKFSFIDLLKLQIIADLRRNCLSIKRIKSILDKISNATFTLSVTHPPEKIKQEKIKFYLLEYAFVRVTNKQRIIALIDDENEIILEPVDKALLYYSGVWQAYPTIIILPFWRYVKNVARLSGKDSLISDDSYLTSLLSKLSSAPTAKEQKILGIIRNKVYEEITIVKKDGISFTIRAKSHRRGTFSDEDVVKIINDKAFQTVAVSMFNGQKITIEREETIKV